MSTQILSFTYWSVNKTYGYFPWEVLLSHLTACGFRHVCEVLVNRNLKTCKAQTVSSTSVFSNYLWGRASIFFITISNLSLQMTWYTVHTCESANTQTSLYPFSGTEPLIQAWMPSLNIMAMSCCCKIF